MNWIALMQPLSLIKCLKIHLQATFVFFCATSVVHIYLLNTDLILLVTSYSVVIIIFLKAYKYIIFDKRWDTFNKDRKMPLER